MRKTLAIIFFYFAVFAHISLAQQWSRPVRISNNLACFDPRLVYSGRILHLIYGSGQNRAFYQRSTDEGLTWSNPFRIDQGAQGITSGRPVIAANGDTVVACWYHNFGGIYNLGFRKSLNGGTDWGVVSFVLPSNVTTLHNHSLCLSDSEIFLIYSYYRDDSIRTCFTRSADLGGNWSFPEEIFAVDAIDDITLRSRGDTLLFLWSAAYSWQDRMELYFCRSTDGGGSWSNIQLLSTFDSSGSQNPCLILNERGELAAFWIDGKYSPYMFTGDVFVRYSSDLGASWSEEQALTDDHLAMFPYALWQGDSLHLTWEDYFQDPGNISYMRSTDSGATWEQRESVDDTSADSMTPALALTQEKVHLLWDERRITEQGIFYTFRTVDHDAIKDGESGFLPENISLSAYPNPFNSATTITLSGIDNAEIEIYDITGRKITSLAATHGRAVWDASGVSSGLYFARMAGERAGTLKLILVK